MQKGHDFHGQNRRCFDDEATLDWKGPWEAKGTFDVRLAARSGQDWQVSTNSAPLISADSKDAASCTGTHQSEPSPPKHCESSVFNTYHAVIVFSYDAISNVSLRMTVNH
jgi:hypothetical protein